MVATFNIKIQAEHANELNSELAQAFDAYRTTIEQLHAEGTFGTPARVRLRWLIDTSNFAQVKQAPVEAEPVETSDPEPITIEERP